MIRAEIITPWVSGNVEFGNHPQLLDDYSVIRFEDVTGQPSENLPLENNMYVILIDVEDEVIGEIKTDQAYHVLWSEEITNER